jgi:hypothetical protein
MLSFHEALKPHLKVPPVLTTRLLLWSVDLNSQFETKVHENGSCPGAER